MSCEACGEPSALMESWTCAGCGLSCHEACDDAYTHPETGERSCESCRTAEMESIR